MRAALALTLAIALGAAGCRRRGPDVTPEHHPGAAEGAPGSVDRDPPPPAETTPDRAESGDRGHDTAGDAAPRGEPEGERGEGFDATLESIPRRPRESGRPGSAAGRGCEGGARAVGERWQVECNTCTCDASGAVTCTVMACLPTAEPGRAPP